MTKSNISTYITLSTLLRNEVSLGPKISNGSLNTLNTRERKLLNYIKLNKFNYNKPP
jgi:hypothetical protein